MVDLELARRLKRIARKKKLRQTELAARMEMDYLKVNRILNGHRTLEAQDLPSFAAALETDVKVLLGLEEA